MVGLAGFPKTGYMYFISFYIIIYLFFFFFGGGGALWRL